MTLHIGIAACSAEGEAMLGRAHAHPEITMHTPSLADYMAPIERGDWDRVGALMLASAEKLAAAGADFVVCPDNTIHAALPLVRARSALPWLHIAEVVAAEAAARGFRRVGITGTRWLVESEVYPAALGARGIQWLRPEPDEREETSRIIMEELVRGDFREASVAFLGRVVARMKEKGCEAVVLGCTELPLVMSDANAPLPTLDSTRLLARAALRRACEGKAREG